MTWVEKCPLHGQLFESKDECEMCLHFVTINFDPENPLCMIEIMRTNTKEIGNV